jgi:TPR repeat protein
MASSKRLTLDQASVAYDKGRYAPALRAFQALADQGDETAYFMLGYAHDTGRGVRRNRAKAMYWYMRAYKAAGASAGMAASNMATIYRDLGKARQELRWYERAAGLGDGDALVEIGIRHLSGKGTRRNPLMAVEHFKAALRSKHVTEAGRDTARQLLTSCRGWKRAV